MPSIKQLDLDDAARQKTADRIGTAMAEASDRTILEPKVLALRNRNIGFLCGDPQGAEAILLHHAASELGARAALVRSELDANSSQGELRHTARLLGRLYDAVLCVGVPLPIVLALREAAGIPVISDETGQFGDLRVAGADPIEAARLLLLGQLAGL